MPVRSAGAAPVRIERRLGGGQRLKQGARRADLRPERLWPERGLARGDHGAVGGGGHGRSDDDVRFPGDHGRRRLDLELERIDRVAVVGVH